MARNLQKDRLVTNTKVKVIGTAQICPEWSKPNRNGLSLLSDVGHILEYSDGTLEIAFHAYPQPGLAVEVSFITAIHDGTYRVCPIIHFENGTAAFDIGKLDVAGNTGTLVIFAIPTFDSEIQLRRLHTERVTQH